MEAYMTIRKLLPAAAVAAAFTAVPMALAQSNSGSAKPESGSFASAEPVAVLMPFAVASADSLANGCWARFYDGENYTGAKLSLVGPVDMPNMRTAFGGDWGGEFDSVAIGPRAKVQVYDSENYGQRFASFKSGDRIPDLGEKKGFFEDIRSLRISCTGQQQAVRDEGTATSGDVASGQAAPLMADPASPQGLRSFAGLDSDGDGSISRSEWNGRISGS
jgi:hypothetical protein